MIRPEVWARISGTTCEHIRYAPCRHPSICALNSSQSPPAKVERRRGSKEKRPKALFTKMSTPPNESTAVPTSLEDCDSSQTSACTAIAKPPSEWMSSTVRCQAFRHSRSYALAGTGDDRCSAIQIHHWTPCHIALLCHYPCLSPCYQPLLPATAQAYSISISNESLYASLPRSTSTARNRSMRLKPPS